MSGRLHPAGSKQYEVLRALEILERFAPYAPAGEVVESQLVAVFQAGERRGRSVWIAAAVYGFAAGAWAAALVIFFASR